MIALTAQSPTILQIVPELETGGAELSAIEMAAAITDAGGRALVVSQGGRMEGALEAAGGELIRLPVATKNPWRIWRNAHAIADLAAANNVALLHARSRAPAWSTLLAARRSGQPDVGTGFIDDIDGLIRQIAVVQIFGTEIGSRFQGGIAKQGDEVIALVKERSEKGDRLKELLELESRFRQEDYDASNSFFGEGFDIQKLLTALVVGAYGLEKAMGIIRQFQRFRRVDYARGASTLADILIAVAQASRSGGGFRGPSRRRRGGGFRGFGGGGGSGGFGGGKSRTTGGFG